MYEQLELSERVPITSVIGMRGIGKTELALQYAHFHLKQKTYIGGICWLACREQNAGLQIIRFARSKFNLSFSKDDDLQTQIDFCWHNWPNGNVLVIFDHVVNYEDISDFLPPGESRFKVLITTRQKWLTQSFQRFELEVLDKYSALELLISYVGSNRIQGELEEAEALCKDLGFLPLGLELVSRYLERKSSLSLAEIRQTLGLEYNSLKLFSTDIFNLKNDAYRAQMNRDFELAEQLWIRVLEMNVDGDAVQALKQIAIDESRPWFFTRVKSDEFKNLGDLKNKQNKTRRKILILGGLAGSSFLAVLAKYLWGIDASEKYKSISEENSSTFQSTTSSTSLSQPKISKLLKESEKGKLFNFEVVKVNSVGSIVNRSQGSARQKIEYLDNGIKLEMIYIPGGTFLMGSSYTEIGRYDREGPQHQVTLKPFYMSKYPITQEQYQIIMGYNPSRFKGKNRPVEKVSWDNATDFCQKLSKKIAGKYSLPSESQWEYACRAGTTTPFYFGKTISTDLANYCGIDYQKWSGSYGNGPKGEYREETTPVGEFPPNAFGLYDMHGNVLEWCADEFHDNYNSAPIDGSVWLDGYKDLSPLRGGSWVDVPNHCRSSTRDIYTWRDDHTEGITGFRVVCDGGSTL